MARQSGRLGPRTASPSYTVAHGGLATNRGESSSDVSRHQISYMLDQADPIQGGERRHAMRDYDGKSATQRIAERRERLIDAGYVLFGEYGYAETSIRMVLRQSGLQDRYFNESFADLDTLLAAVHARIVEEELVACREVTAATGGSATDRARAVLEVMMRSLDRDRGRARIKLHEVLSAGPASRAQRRKDMDAMAAIVADLLPGGAKRSRQLIAVSLVAATYELANAWLDGERGLSRKGVVDLVMMLFESVSEHVSSDRPTPPHPLAPTSAKPRKEPVRSRR